MRSITRASETVIDGLDGGRVTVADVGGTVTLRTPEGATVELGPQAWREVMAAMAIHGSASRRRVAEFHAEKRRLRARLGVAGLSADEAAGLRAELGRVEADLRWLEPGA